MEHLWESGTTTTTTNNHHNNNETAAHHRRRGMATTTAHDDAMTSTTEYDNMEKDGILRPIASMEHGHTATASTVAATASAAESHTRSLLKGLTWRIVATSTTTVIAYIITGHVEAALQIGFFEFFAKLVIYYWHERIWTQIRI